MKSSGSVRTIKGFASSERSEDIWDDYVAYYGDANWLDTFVSSAIDGTGHFAGEADGVRKQGIQKGIQNQVMIAWTIHELVAALAKANDGNFDAETGAPHNWDEAWAFYAGVEPGSGPFGTADKRGGNFGTGSAVNDAILKAMDEGREALLNRDGGRGMLILKLPIASSEITSVDPALIKVHQYFALARSFEELE